MGVPLTVNIGKAQPGIYAAGNGQGIIIGFPGYQLIDAAHPATAGDTAIIYCTGLGATSAAVATGQPAPFDQLAKAVVPVTVTVGGVNAAVSFAGLTPGSVGLYQVNIQIPAGVAAGAAVPVVITQGAIDSNQATIAVK